MRGVELWSSSFGHVARKIKPIVEELIHRKIVKVFKQGHFLRELHLGKLEP